MNKFVTLASEIRLNALVCSSITVLLAACGGANPDTPAQGSQPDRNLAMVSSVDAAAPAEAPAADRADIGPAPAATPAPAEFSVKGYDATAAGKADTAEPGATLTLTDASVQPQLVSGDAPVTAMAVTPATPYNYYVSPTGNDNNSGTSGAPWRTLARAARATKAGTTIWVAPGTYTGGFKTTTSGTASSRIYWVSTTRWGARVIPPSSSPNNTGWDNRGSYVDIIGFDIDGSAFQSGTRWLHGIYSGGSYNVIRNNHVHHIAINVSCTSAGGSAIGVDSYYYGVMGTITSNLVHDIGPAGCRYVQGIYMSTTGSITNNVVYRVAEGAIHLWHDAHNVTIANNTVAASNTGIIVGANDHYHYSGPADYVMVYNNIVFDNRMGVSEQGTTGTHNSYRNNLVYQNSTYNWSLKNGLTHYNTVASNPLFISYTRTGTPNLRISTSSPAIGRGTSSYAPSTDFLDRPRNSTTGYDIGAYQH